MNNYRKIFFGIAFAIFMVNLDTYIVNISLPIITNIFQVSSDSSAWIILSYQLAIIGFLLLFGNLGDKFGLKKLFLAGLLVFSTGSLLCGLSSSLLFLIFSRAVQGIGASILYALTTAMIPKFIPQEKQGSAFGVMATMAALGITIGAPLGGFITEYLSWNWVFLINVPVGFLAIFYGYKILPDDSAKKPSDGSTHDIFGYFAGFFGPALIIYSLNQARQFGWTSPVMIIMLSLAILLLVILIIREGRIKHPLFEPAIFKNKRFSYSNTSLFFACIYLTGNNFLVPFYLIHCLDLKPDTTGLVFMVYPLVYMIVGPITGKISNRVNPVKFNAISMLIGAISAIYMIIILPCMNITLLIIYFILLAFTYGTFFPSNSNIVMNSAPHDKRGIASAIFRLIGIMGMALGVCVFEFVFSTSIGYSGLDKSINLSTVPDDKMIPGFQSVYYLGVFLFIISFIFSLLSRKENYSSKSSI